MSNELELNKDRADADRYYKLFADKVGKFEDGERILFIHIGNFDVLDRFIQSNPNCSYFIIDQHLNGPWFKMSWDCKFIGTNEDDSIIKALDTLNMKFDKIIMNPPFGKLLHLQILKEALKYLNENGTCINLSPVRWLQDFTINFNICDTFNQFEDSICKHLVDLTVIPHEDANKIFEIAHCDLGVYKLQKSPKKIYDYLSLSKANISNELYTLLSKLKKGKFFKRSRGFHLNKKDKEEGNKTKVIQKWIDAIDDKYEYFFFLSFVNGAMNASWRTKKLTDLKIFKKERLFDLLSEDLTQKMLIGFTKNELNSAKNIFNLVETNCLRFGLALTQDSQAMNSKCYTFFPDIDYSNIKTEQDFYKCMNITEDEQKLIEKTMEKYK